jgi:hypothetical protein
MGASSWRYYTTYRSDAEAALQELRRDVFARGEYSFGFGGFAPAGNPAANPTDLPTTFGTQPPQATALFEQIANAQAPEGRIMRAALSGDFTDLNAQERHAAEQIRPLLQMFQPGAFGDDDDEDGEDGPRVFPPGHRPETIEELLEMVAEDGTHSVLDIEQTGSRLGFGVAAPLSPRQVARYFGTEQPTHEQVERNWGDVSERLDRWQAYYVTVYRDGQPHEYAFIGCSGD